MKVLYADSDIEVRDYVSMLLEAGLDCEILEASSGNEAVSILEFEEDIDFIITEVKMKGGNGNVIIDHLDQKKSQMPIVWLSDSENKEVMLVSEVLARSPLNAFVPKPFRDTDFFPVIDKILIEREKAFADELDSIFDEGEDDGCDDGAKTQSFSSDDWNETSKEDSQAEADWSILKKGAPAEVDAGYSLKKEFTSKEEEASYSLKKEFSAKEDEAGYSLKKDFSSKEEEAGYSLKREFNSREEEADYSLKKKETTWDSLRERNNQQELEKIKKESKVEGTTHTDEEEHIDGIPYDTNRFRRVRIKRFLNFSTVNCDVFIQLNPKKYLKLIHANDDFEKEKIEKYEDKGKKYLFIENEEYEKFANQFGDLIYSKMDEALKHGFDVGAVAQLAALDNTLELAREFGVTEVTAKKVRRSVEVNLNTLKSLPKLDSMITRILKGGDYISEHSLLLSYFVGQICLATSWGNPQTLEKLSMAALLHDISLTSNKLAHFHHLEDAKKEGLDEKEIELIRSHPGEAAKLISQGENIFSDVDTIVLQHHEQPDQSGFPRGLSAINLSPLSCIFIIASEFTERVTTSPGNKPNMEMVKAEFKNKFNRGNFKKPLEAFLKVF